MPLINLLIVLVIIGVIVWLVNTYVPMDSKLKMVFNVVVALLTILWLLGIFTRF